MVTVRRLRLTRHPRGFTLLELVIVAAVASVLFAILIQWVLTLASVSQGNLAAASTARTADLARTAFAADMAAAIPCDVAVTSPVRSVGPDALTVTVRRTESTAVDLVTWRVAGSQLQRAVVRHADAEADPCLFAADPLREPQRVAWQTFATGVTPVDQTRVLAGSATPAFVTVTGAQTALELAAAHGRPAASAYGSCAPGAGDDFCYATGVAVSWLLRTPTGHGPATVARSFPFSSTFRGLS